MLLQNLRFGARLLSRQVGMTAVVVATFSLGIGLTGAMFCVVRGALRELPFPAAGRLLHLEESIPARNVPGLEVTLHDFLDWRRRQRSFEDLAAFSTGGADLASPGQPAERVQAAFMTAGALPMLRVAPWLGRTFVEAEEGPGGARVAVLGEAVWRSRFGGDPRILGRIIRVDGEPTTVIGVMPRGFRFPVHEDLWLPLRVDPRVLRRGEGTGFEVFGRLRPGASPASARLDLANVARQLAAEYPETNTGVEAVVKPYVEEFVPRQIRALLWTMLGAVFGVLLVACANVANLLLARTVLRRQEIAVRVALGASRRRIAAQWLTETLLTSAAGSLGGLALAAAAMALFRSAVAATDPPFWIQFRIDLPVVAFVAGLALLSALAAGWAPALHAARQEVGEVLKDEGTGHSAFRSGRLVRALVVSEIAVTVALLAAAGLMMRTIINLRTADYGFPPAEVLTARIELHPGRFPTPDSRRQLFRALLQRVAAVPGVRSACLASSLPVTPAGRTPFALEGLTFARDRELPLTRQLIATPELLQTLGLHPLAGRDLGPGDREHSLRVALVDRSFAARFLPGGSPLGRRIRLGPEPWRTIVGVIPDLRLGGPEDRDSAAVVVPLAQADASGLSLAVRRGANRGVAGAVRAEVQRLDPDLALGAITDLDEVIRRETWFYGVFGTLFLVFGGAALFLAAVGLSGVMAFSVSRRVHEIGIRRALGAGTADIRRMILRQAGLQVALGLLIGWVLGLVLGRAIRFIAFGAEPWDPWQVLALAAILALVCAGACLVPLRRAVRIDPAVALRQS